MIKIVKDIPQDDTVIVKMFTSRANALHEAESLDRQGRNPRLVRSLSGVGLWWVWYKMPPIAGWSGYTRRS